MIKYASFYYSKSSNIGDQIQTLAVQLFFPRIDRYFDRDNLSNVQTNKDDKYLLIMNGWFSHSPETSLPTPPAIAPIFFSFHITKKAKKYYSSDKMIKYFKENEPIGCRDSGTINFICKILFDFLYPIKKFFNRIFIDWHPQLLVLKKKKKLLLKN